MSYFTDPTPFTHYGSLYGIPIYLNDPDDPESVIAGTNAFYDWLLTWFPEQMQFLLSLLSEEHAQGFAICVKGKLRK